MKQETGKKQNKWLLPVIIIAALLVIAGIVIAIFALGGNNEEPAGADGVTAEIYWNLDRKDHLDPDTGLSIRAAGEDGLYHIRFAKDGETVELTANDKKLVNRIDMMDHMGLDVDASGNITNVVATADVCTVAAENFFVQKMEGGTLLINSSAALNGMEMPFQVDDATGIYNVSDLAEVPGGVDEPEPMDKVVVLQSNEGKTTHVFIVERKIATDVYWRLEQYYNSTKKITTRVPDAAGVYTIGFAVNGEQVELKCKDVDIVTYIDSLSNNVQCIGLTFDEQGFINGTVTPADAVRGALVSNQFDVTELTETSMTTTRMLPSSNQGSTWTGNFAADCKFYDVTGVSGFIGIEVESLKLNDRVYVLTNAMGEAKIVFITNRMVESELYWMTTVRKYSSTTKLTTQAPDENGWYVMEFIKNGKIVKLRTKDIAIASQVHANSNVPMGLKLDGDVITQVYHYVNVTGGWVVAAGATVTSINGPIVTVMSSGTTTSLVLSADCEIINAFDYVEKGFGEYTELKIGDQVRSFRNAAGEIVAIYITGRAVEGQVYWNVTRKVSNNETTRTPLTTGEYEGYYEIVLTTGGKRATKYYTKSKKIASNIDRQYPQSVGLQVKGNIITAAVPSSCVTGGSTMANYCHAEYWIEEGYEFYALYRATGNGTKVKYNSETKIYNVSAGATNYVGQAEKALKLNDQVHVITDISGTAKYIYIVGQTVEGEPYYTLGSTTDENGNVTFKMLHKGKVVELKAKDADVAAEVKSFSIGMGLHVKNGVITRAFSIASLSTYGSATAANFDVMKVSGNTLTLKRTRPSASNQGQEATVELASGIKFYDVSSYAETPGQVVKPKVGDRVVMYLNEEGTQAAIGYVTYRHTREGGAFGKCDHCGKTVYWNHWEGSFAANAYLEKDNDTVHYYVPSDRQLTKQILAGNADQTLKNAVLDLNGKTITSSVRALGAWYGATLYVMDSSKAQTGTVIGAGATSTKGDGAGVVLTTRGGSVVIYGGTWKVAEEHNLITDGGILNGFSHPDWEAGTITINGGKFYGTDVTGNGGVVASNAPDIIINGGEFFGGEAGNIGGTIACPKAQLTINGGIIHGGKANYGATISCPNLIINGGTIEAGEAVMNGDCMYVSAGFNVTINGGTVASVTTTTTWKGTAVITGAPEIGELTVADGKYVDMTGVTGGKITVAASGAFTTKFASDDAAKAVAKFITPGVEDAEIFVKDQQIWIQIRKCIYGHTVEEHTAMEAAGEACTRPEILVWKQWTSGTSLPTATGNYILTKNVTTSSQTSITGKNVVIDLNGFDVTYKIPTARTQNFRVFYLNDSENSNGKTAGATPSKLIITDNSTDDVTQQGTVTAINPEYAPSSVNVEEWTAAGKELAERTYTVDGVKAYADKTALTAIDNEAKTKADTAAKAAAALKGAEGTAEYTKEYNTVYETEYKAAYAAIKAEKYQSLYETAYDAKIATAEANQADLLLSAEAAVQASGEFTDFTSDAYKAAVEAELEKLTAEAIEAYTKSHVDGLIASNKALHEAADTGMIVQVANGNFELLGGNLDASGLTTKKAGTAIFVNAVLTTMDATKSQTVLIENGTVSGGTTTANGGTISVAKGATLNIAGGTINGGTLTEKVHGATIYADGATVNMYGGVMNGGNGPDSNANSGAIYANGSSAVINIGGDAVINPGKIANGDSLYIRFGTWTIGGSAKINGGVGYSTADLTISGSPVIQKVEGGSEYSIKYHADAKFINIEDLQPGAKIAFSTKLANLSNKYAAAPNADLMQSWIDAGYFVNETGAGDFAVVDGALVIGEYEMQCVYGHTEHTGENADCAEPIELWQKWTDMTKLPTADGNYFIEEGATITTASQTIINDTERVINVKLDLRGGKVVHPSGTVRFMLIKGAAGSLYTITSTKAQSTIETTATAVTATGNDAVFYCNIGGVRLINLKVDASSIKTNTQNYSIAYLSNAGILQAEGCELIGGASKQGIAIYQTPHTDATAKQLVLKDTTVYGGVYVAGSALRTHLSGTVKLLPNDYCSYGISGAAAAAEIKCHNLTADSELVVANMTYSFADEAAATAAANVIIKPAPEKKIVTGTAALKVETSVEYCINGHKTEAECQAADCTEEILEWTEWTTTDKLPTADGNYYVPEGTGITMSSQCIINDTSRVVDIKLDLRGNTVTVNGESTRALLLKADPTSQYQVISTTAAKATFKTTATTQGVNANGFIYANSGKIVLRNIKVDTTSVTSGATYSTVAHVLANGILVAENCELIGGYSSNGAVINQTPAASDYNLILKNTTVSGGFQVNGSATKTKLEGVVKLLPGVGTFGIKGSAAAAEFDCTSLLEGSELVAANCNYRFADATAAAAANGVIIKAATGSALSVNGAVITSTVQ